MLKPRIIGTVVVKDGWAVQSIGFERFLPIGRPEVSVEALDRYGVDEIALIDISATRDGRGTDAQIIERCAPCCHVPIAAGGGVTTIAQMHTLVRNGADKIIINTAALDTPSLITEGAHQFGSQCMLVSIDARRRPDGTHEVYSHCGTRPRGLTPEEAARNSERNGAGEILINSIDEDGRKRGYDVALLNTVRAAVSIPVIAVGGAGHPAHFAAALKAGVSAVAAGNMLNYTEHSVGLIKRHLTQNAFDLRTDSYASYENASFDEDGRLVRQSEDVLHDLLFTRIEEEVI